MLEYLFQIFERTLNNCAFYCHDHSWLKLLNEVGVLRGISYSISDDILIIADFLGDSYYHDFLFYCAVGDYLKNGFSDNDDFIIQDFLNIRIDIEKEDPK